MMGSAAGVRLGLAVAQTSPVRGDVAANARQHVQLAEIAAAHGARIVLFPELSLTGYELDLAQELAFTEADARLDPLRRAAAELRITLIAGAPVRLDGSLHIGAFILAPDGPPALYTKQHLGAFGPSAARDGVIPPSEMSVFQPGTHDPLVPFGDGMAAVAVCADIGHAAHAERAAARGADAYLASMFVIPSELDAEQRRLRDYARSHGLVVAMANYTGASGGLDAAGSSTIWSPTGRQWVRLQAGGVGVGVVVQVGGEAEPLSVMLPAEVDA